MGNYIDRVLDDLKVKHAGEEEFIQATEEVLESISCVVDADDRYEKVGLLERLVEPERSIQFRIPWVDDEGKVNVNLGYRVQFNSAIGPYKGGIRFHPSVHNSIIKFLGFEQIFKNALTGLPIGGGKAGSDFNPSGKSDQEVMRFCQSFMTELYRHIGPNTDVPAGDLGVGPREIGYMFGQYKRIVNKYEGVLTGKALSYGGLNGRTEATGFGIVYFANSMLEANGEKMKDKTVALSGFGNVAWGATLKLQELGAKVLTISGPDGYILDEDGINTDEKIKTLQELRASGRDICAPYAEKYPSAKFFPGEKPWGVKADLYIPCAMQNDIHLEHAKMIVDNGAKFICEGANMPCTNEAVKYMMDKGMVVGPSKAANAGGVACSCIEMGQNASHAVYSPEDVHAQLKDIMKHIHDSSQEAAEEYGLGYNLVAGANIAGFKRVAEAMLAQGIV